MIQNTKRMGDAVRSAAPDLGRTKDNSSGAPRRSPFACLLAGRGPSFPLDDIVQVFHESSAIRSQHPAFFSEYFPDYRRISYQLVRGRVTLVRGFPTVEEKSFLQKPTLMERHRLIFDELGSLFMNYQCPALCRKLFEETVGIHQRQDPPPHIFIEEGQEVTR
ncbi:MAG TPA: hypothetical protein VD913_03175 [bacterium]|nr:hypothetical protein [bacterium]